MLSKNKVVTHDWVEVHKPHCHSLCHGSTSCAGAEVFDPEEERPSEQAFCVDDEAPPLLGGANSHGLGVGQPAAAGANGVASSTVSLCHPSTSCFFLSTPQSNGNVRLQEQAGRFWPGQQCLHCPLHRCQTLRQLIKSEQA